MVIPRDLVNVWQKSTIEDEDLFHKRGVKIGFQGCVKDKSNNPYNI